MHVGAVLRPRRPVYLVRYRWWIRVRLWLHWMIVGRRRRKRLVVTRIDDRCIHMELR